MTTYRIETKQDPVNARFERVLSRLLQGNGFLKTERDGCDLLYLPCLNVSERETQCARLYISTLRAGSFEMRCAVRIKRYREPVFDGPVYICRDASAASWGELTIVDELQMRRSAAAAAPIDALARQTARGLCDAFRVQFRDV